MKTIRFIAKSILIFLVFAQPGVLIGQESIVIQADKKIAPIQPTLWGIFFEDINFALDGGLYAELVKNRSFEFDKPLMGWQEIKEKNGIGSLQILNRENEYPNNPRYLRISKLQEQGNYGILNEGFRGMGIKEANTYHFSVWARKISGNTKLILKIISDDASVLSEAQIIPVSEEWKKYTVDLKAVKTCLKANLQLLAEGVGVTDIDFVSLFPDDTWKNRPGGLRNDLVQLLADLKPGFVRFPGGCVVEGRNLSERYQWKKTLNRVEDRKLMMNRWNMEFAHRLTPDYFQSLGVGFYEYFQLAEDLKAEPLPILSCGMACQFNTAELTQLSDMQGFVQDALDLIEFANGDTSTFYGNIRKKMGHESPFNLHYIGVGNEQWGPQYIERYKIMTDALKKSHPEIKIIGSVGPSPDGEQFNYLWSEMDKLKPALVDEHYYCSPEWFQKNINRYDSYSRTKPKIFVGEFAAQSVKTCSPDNKNNWNCAISEAAYMTGLERNADLVYMASYAPLFGHLDAWQWKPNLIWFDNLKSFGTANYQIHKLFSNSKGSQLIQASLNNLPVTGQNGIYCSASLDEPSKELIIKIVNLKKESQLIKFQIKGLKLKSGDGSLISLKSDNLEQENSIEFPLAVSPKSSKLQVKGSSIEINLDSYSVNVVKLKY